MSDDGPRLKGKAEEFDAVLRDHLPDLRERYGVESLGIFGSYLREEESAESDLNVYVDLVMKRALKPRIGKRILAEVVQV